MKRPERLEVRVYGPGRVLLEVDRYALPPRPHAARAPCVVAIDMHGHGKVHHQGCFIVTTRWPDLPWEPHPGPPTCHFCLEV
jgi:hypothetical protein